MVARAESRRLAAMWAAPSVSPTSSVVVVRRGRFKRVGQAVVAVGALLNLVWRVAVPVHGGKKYRIRKCDYELLHV